jgi:formate hydrogenlyase subunit 3/multisubunit Na+/H+ antiporter MnhD subunit
MYFWLIFGGLLVIGIMITAFVILIALGRIGQKFVDADPAKRKAMGRRALICLVILVLYCIFLYIAHGYIDRQATPNIIG